MDDRELDKLLQKLPHIFGSTLSSFKFTEEMRRTVLERTSPNDLVGKKARKYRFTLFTRVAVIVVFFLLGGGSVLFWQDNRGGQTEVPTFTQIESMAIDLDGKSTLGIVNTWEVKEKDILVSLLALIWARDQDGHWQLMSSQTMQGQEFLPLEVLKPGYHEGNLVVIATVDGEDLVFYRVLGYNGQEVLVHLERSTEFFGERHQLLQELEELLPVKY